MTRTSLDDAQWASLMLVMQQIPRAWKRDEVPLRRFIAAAFWIGRTGAPWRDLPEALGPWSTVYHRWRRWCLRGWWELIFEALRPSLPVDGLILLDSKPIAPRVVPRAAQPRPKRSAGAVVGFAPSSMPALMARAVSCG
jgi:transposase